MQFAVLTQNYYKNNPFRFNYSNPYYTIPQLMQIMMGAPKKTVKDDMMLNGIFTGHLNFS